MCTLRVLPFIPLLPLSLPYRSVANPPSLAPTFAVFSLLIVPQLYPFPFRPLSSLSYLPLRLTHHLAHPPPALSPYPHLPKTGLEALQEEASEQNFEDIADDDSDEDEAG